VPATARSPAKSWSVPSISPSAGSGRRVVHRDRVLLDRAELPGAPAAPPAPEGQDLKGWNRIERLSCRAEILCPRGTASWLGPLIVERLGALLDHLFQLRALDVDRAADVDIARGLDQALAQDPGRQARPD